MEESNKPYRWVKHGGTGSRKTYRQFVFYCNKSGNYRCSVKEVDRKRRLKTQGSVKMNANCTASIVATEYKNGIIHVRYYKTHYGHEVDDPLQIEEISEITNNHDVVYTSLSSKINEESINKERIISDIHKKLHYSKLIINCVNDLDALRKIDEHLNSILLLCSEISVTEKTSLQLHSSEVLTCKQIEDHNYFQTPGKKRKVEEKKVRLSQKKLKKEAAQVVDLGEIILDIPEM